MKSKALCFSGIMLIGLAMPVSAECPIGYRPSVGVLRATENDLSFMELSEGDRSSMQGKIRAFRSREEKLRSEFHDKSMSLSTMLSGGLLDRAAVDALSFRLAEIIQELNELRVSYSLDMLDVLKADNRRRIRTRPVAADSRCEGSVPFPAYRYELTAREKELIGVTADERRYLKDFNRREEYFRKEQQDLRQRLDLLLSSRDVDRVEVVATLRQLAASVRARTTNRLDRYFYADKILFSPDRAEKLLSHRAKNDQRNKKISPATRIKPERKTPVKEKEGSTVPGKTKKWYWPF